MTSPPRCSSTWSRASRWAGIGTPEEVAAAISWLASDESTFTTGQTLDLSGGRSTY